jgi:hypothetical protein
VKNLGKEVEIQKTVKSHLMMHLPILVIPCPLHCITGEHLEHIAG